MTLEEKIHAMANKGELVHLSLAADGKNYRAIFAPASQAGGYATGCDPDPVRALMAALNAPIVKTRQARPSRSDSREGSVRETQPDDASKEEEEITETVTPKRSGKLRDYMNP